MSFNSNNLICVSGNSRASQWAYTTYDRPGEVLDPGYFPDDRTTNFMRPGETLTITCWQPGRTDRSNPVMVVQGVTARTMAGVWIFLCFTKINPEKAARNFMRGIGRCVQRVLKPKESAA